MVKEPKSGDYISFELSGAAHSGLVLSSSTKEVLYIKLENGYNIGVKKNNLKQITFMKVKGPKEKKTSLKSKGNLPKVVLITTGGTITSSVDYETGAVRSLTKPESLLAQIPELSKLVNLKILSPFNVMSEDMNHTHWQDLAKLVHKELQDKSVRGAIVTHGTDILHWTAMALSFMLGTLDKPIALVGGQRSSDRGSFDGAQNLICAVHYCLSDINQVAVVMHGSSEDKFCIVSPGAKVRKMHTSRRDAFRPINTLPLAKIWPDGKIERIAEKRAAATKFDTSFEPKVALVKFAANSGPDMIDYYVSKGYKGIILEGEGLGHVPVNGKLSWVPSIKSAVKKKIFVGMTSQCLYGRVDPHVYSNLCKINEAGVVFLSDMLPEAAYIKLSCALGRAKNKDAATKLMLDNWVGEFSERLDASTFLY